MGEVRLRALGDGHCSNETFFRVQQGCRMIRAPLPQHLILSVRTVAAGTWIRFGIWTTINQGESE